MRGRSHPSLNSMLTLAAIGGVCEHTPSPHVTPRSGVSHLFAPAYLYVVNCAPPHARASLGHSGGTRVYACCSCGAEGAAWHCMH
jgi:hypothetical protein